MFNFFFNGENHSLFRKALKSTKDEPVIINILSTDSSLVEETKKDEVSPAAHKNLSNKFQPSPFGKFFGPRKQRTTPVDMGNFSSWKNKNFREVEQNLGATEDAETRFSLADYMSRNTETKTYNDSDQLTSETQKPITQLSTDDPTYKKYSLDSYLHKLEEQAKVKDKFQLNDDLLEPLGDDIQSVVPDSSQDENFGGSSTVNIEDISFDENIKGERFAFEQSELDKVKSKIDHIQRETEKTQKLIQTNELSKLAKSDENDDNFDLSKLGVDDDESSVDDIEKINKKLLDEQEDDANSEKPKITHKRFSEINKTPTGKPKPGSAVGRIETDEDLDLSEVGLNESDLDEDGEYIDEMEPSEITGAKATGLEESESSDIGDVSETHEGVDVPEDLEESDESNVDISEEHVMGDEHEFVKGTKLTRDDILTKDDLKTMTDELVSKFTEMYKKDEKSVDTDVNPVGDGNGVVPVGVGEPYDYAQGLVETVTQFGQEPTTIVQPVGVGFAYPSGQQQDDTVQKQQAELQAKILEMIESNKRADAEALEKLRQAEIEKTKVAEEYEEKLRKLEESFRKRDEEAKKQAYLDKLKNDIKMKKAQTKFKKREEEILESGKLSSEHVKIGVMLKKELESNLNISNLEMDKKLLEVASKVKKEQEEIEIAKEPKPAKVEEVEVIEEVEETPKKTVKRTTTRKKTTTRRTSRSHTRTPKRKIDSDIIGGINFD